MSIHENREVIYYGGKGYESVPEDGEFLVRHGFDARLNHGWYQSFKTLSAAREFLNNCKGQRVLWDATNEDRMCRQLLESWLYGPPLNMEIRKRDKSC